MSEFFRSFLPLGNPFGFGAQDFLIFTLAVLLFAMTLGWAFLEAPARRFAEKTAWCMLLLGMLPVLLRLALLPAHPVPTPDTADDMSYLLLGDTIAHFRLANPVHPMHRFFETLFVLQEPSYSSMYPPGQGIALAFGQLVFGSPWAGVLLLNGALCSLTYWMLRAWITPLWALTGGLLAVIEFGPLNQWTNSYWGGALSAVAGCLVFGALPRLHGSEGRRAAILLGLGAGLQMITRPFETVLLLLSILAYFVMIDRKPRLRLLIPAALAFLPAIALTFAHNHAVTRSWTTLPYMSSREQYGVPATFTFQANPVPHRPLTPAQDLNYRAHILTHGDGTDTIRSYVERLGYRLRFYRFFFFTPLYLALLGFFVGLRDGRAAWAFVVVAIFHLGTNFYPYFHPQYVAALTCVFVLMSLMGLDRLSRWSAAGSRIIIFLCAAQFLFWYGVHASGSDRMLAALIPYETWDYINYGDVYGHVAINRTVAGLPGKQLVFVRYGPRHVFDEWIHNTADIDRARVVFAGDLGPAENDELRRYYPDRTAWQLEPDVRPPRLTPYEAQTSEPPAKKAEPVEPVAKPRQKMIDPKLFETVR